MMTNKTHISDPDFLKIVDLTPLVSLDLIIINERHQILLGLRNNAPAKDFWFVPGGRIQKNQRLEDAFRDILFQETGIESDLRNAQHRGVYEHFYDDNYQGIKGVSTHYVVNAFELNVHTSEIQLNKDDQHQAFRWVSIDELRSDEHVHQYTKDYF